MATENMRSAKARLYVNTGKDPQTGRKVVKNVLIGELKNATIATADKIVAVGTALAPCLEYQVTRVERVVSSSIEA